MKATKIYSLAYKSFMLALTTVGFYLIIYDRDFDSFAFYTIISNICVFGFTLALWILTLKDVKNGDFYSKNTHLVRYRGIAMLCIFITGVIYATALADYTKDSNYTIRNILHHYVIPIMFVLDYFLFDKKGLIKWYNPLIWIGCSVCYLPYIFIRAQIVKDNPSLTKYPYFFLDVDDQGLTATVFWCIGLVVVFSLVSYLLFLYDYKKGKKENIESNSNE